MKLVFKHWVLCYQTASLTREINQQVGQVVVLVGVAKVFNVTVRVCIIVRCLPLKFVINNLAMK